MPGPFKVFRLIVLVSSLICSDAWAIDRDFSRSCVENLFEMKNGENRLYEIASQLVSMNPTLAARIEFGPPVDSATKTLQSLRGVASQGPERQEILQTLTEAQSALKEAAAPGQALILKILQQSLSADSDCLSWDSNRKKFILSCLVIKDDQRDSASVSMRVRIREADLMIGHKPKLSDPQKMKAAGFTHVVTLLSEREGALEIGERVRAAGLEWVWFPMAGAEKKLETKENAVVKDFLVKKLAPLFTTHQSTRPLAYLHCSAGMHRTGMITFALLRELGFERGASIEILGKLRPLTAESLDSEKESWVAKILSAH